MADFSQNAAGIAASASIAFLMALGASVLQETAEQKDSFLDLVSIFGTIAGFILLAIAGLAMVGSLPNADLGINLVLHSVLLTLWIGVLLRMVSAHKRARSENAARPWVLGMSLALVVLASVGVGIYIVMVPVVILHGQSKAPNWMILLQYLAILLSLAALPLHHFLHGKYLKRPIS